MRRDPIVIQPHDPQWAQDFDVQRAALEPVLAGRLVAPVEHIGSTSVPGLPAKPIIDMVAVIDDYAGFAPALPELERIGWVHAPEPDDERHRKWSVCFPKELAATDRTDRVRYRSGKASLIDELMDRARAWGNPTGSCLDPTDIT